MSDDEELYFVPTRRASGGMLPRWWVIYAPFVNVALVITFAVGTAWHVTGQHRYETSERDLQRVQTQLQHLEHRTDPRRVGDMFIAASNRASTLHERLDSLEQRLAALQQAISPETAPEILNIERMKQEIAARKTFEENVSKRLDAHERRVSDILTTSSKSIEATTKSTDDTRSQLATMVYTLLGIAITVIGGLILITYSLFKKNRELYAAAQGVLADPPAPKVSMTVPSQKTQKKAGQG